MHSLLSVLLHAAVLVLGVILAPQARAQDAPVPTVVVSISPIHSLAAQVMAGVGTPRLLIPPGLSEHTQGLRPSDARALAEAQLVVWVGPTLETPLAKPIAALAGNADVLQLSAATGLELLPVRKGGAWEHDHHGHGHEHAHAHEHEHGHGHGHESQEVPDAHASDAQGKAGRDLQNMDAHIWLDPDNAKAIVRELARALAKLDPGRAALYAENAAKASQRITALDAELTEKLASVKRVPFVVFHDAYQYFEQHYGLSAVGAVTLGPERGTGAQRLIRLRQRIHETGAACVFSEPQFEPRLVATLTEGMDVRTSVLDPLGASLEPGPGQYQRLMQDLAGALVGCLSAGRPH